ncbi:Flp/Fap pilin component [Pelotomaculum schinkii]|uniref:Flp/Fap pilin component n=1 Tax=Pelotomaculum schinkii TaxID=78350 RepID=A0A4Y7RE30_9FIRM|nr:Flp family type IVb pilin [Pelotomaculum schinkii]TEB07000.1 Flp/Fap pilin component [Pelotomaculum schinkii]
MINVFKKLMVEESGQGMAEYGLILALVAVIVVAALTTLGEGIRDKLTEVNGELTPETTE